MKRIVVIILAIWLTMPVISQQKMTPELLWQLKRISAIGLTDDGNHVIYRVTSYSMAGNNSISKNYRIAIRGGNAIEMGDYSSILSDRNLSPDKKHQLSIAEVKVKPVSGTDFYPDMDKSEALIYDHLNYRHWDTWEDGKFSHVFVQPVVNGNIGPGKDIMSGEPYDCPQKPFGGSEDYIWNHDGTKVLYVTKKEYGTEYAKSTNTDIYSYDLESGTTTNLTESNKGYDTQPAFSKNGILAWCQMDEAGYESDKNDIVIQMGNQNINLTRDWDGTVNSFLWSRDGMKIYFNAPVMGTVQLFELNIPETSNVPVLIKQLTQGQFDVSGLVGQSGNTLVVSRTDMNHAAELYTVDLMNGHMTQLTHENDGTYSQLKIGDVKPRMVKTTDGKQMLSWVIYPPDFDPNKKYPTLLYCQGGPQSALSQFYSFRWNFQLMAANSYIIIAPNRRGMPGHGVQWNEQISGDYGGQNMKDYLSAIDDLCKEKYVDKERLGCIGASYGGYSVFYLAGIHKGRFKTFIAHDGIFNTRSMYGSTEELFFTDKDLGGPYWKKGTKKSYKDFNPIEKVNNWNTPILIFHGGKDYRIPYTQAMEAFQVAQLKGIKSKFVYFPNENHWVLSLQNGIVWQREFFKWLEETL